MYPTSTPVPDHMCSIQCIATCSRVSPLSSCLFALLTSSFKVPYTCKVCLCLSPLRNKVTSIIMKDVPGSPGWCSCLFTSVTNCQFRPGSSWINLYDNYYNSSEFTAVRKTFPGRFIVASPLVAVSPCRKPTPLSPARPPPSGRLPPSHPPSSPPTRQLTHRPATHTHSRTTDPLNHPPTHLPIWPLRRLP